MSGIELFEKYGLLQVVSESFMKDVGTRRRRFINVRCECGTEKSVNLTDLTLGKISSCGCLKGGSETHGMSKTRIYRIWADMKKRCQNPNHKYFLDYGGRGISYQESWESFESFFEDMEEGYSDDLELDRIDNESNYSKQNCRWTTRAINCHNRRKRKGSGCNSVGVCKHGSGYRASMYFDGEQVLNKTFKTEEEAARIYDDFSEKYYGDRPNNTSR